MHGSVTDTTVVSLTPNRTVRTLRTCCTYTRRAGGRVHLELGQVWQKLHSTEHRARCSHRAGCRCPRGRAGHAAHCQARHRSTQGHPRGLRCGGCEGRLKNTGAVAGAALVGAPSSPFRIRHRVRRAFLRWAWHWRTLVDRLHLTRWV